MRFGSVPGSSPLWLQHTPPIKAPGSAPLSTPDSIGKGRQHLRRSGSGLNSVPEPTKSMVSHMLTAACDTMNAPATATANDGSCGAPTTATTTWAVTSTVSLALAPQPQPQPTASSTTSAPAVCGAGDLADAPFGPPQPEPAIEAAAKSVPAPEMAVNSNADFAYSQPPVADALFGGPRVALAAAVSVPVLPAPATADTLSGGLQPPSAAQPEPISACPAPHAPPPLPNPSSAGPSPTDCTRGTLVSRNLLESAEQWQATLQAALEAAEARAERLASENQRLREAQAATAEERRRASSMGEVDGRLAAAGMALWDGARRVAELAAERRELTERCARAEAAARAARDSCERLAARLARALEPEVWQESQTPTTARGTTPAPLFAPATAAPSTDAAPPADGGLLAGLLVKRASAPPPPSTLLVSSISSRLAPLAQGLVHGLGRIAGGALPGQGDTESPMSCAAPTSAASVLTPCVPLGAARAAATDAHGDSREVLLTLGRRRFEQYRSRKQQLSPSNAIARPSPSVAVDVGAQ